MDGISASRVGGTVAEAAPSILGLNRAPNALPSAEPTELRERHDVTRSPAVDVSAGSRDGAAESHSSPPDRDELTQLAEQLNRVFAADKGIRFDFSEDGGELVVQVVDLQSDEVIRTIPPERLAELHRRFDDLGTGVLVDQHA